MAPQMAAETAISHGTDPAGDIIPFPSMPKGKTWIPINEEPAYMPHRIRIICAGAGYSGLMLAHQVKYHPHFRGCFDLTIYDKNADVGGTWFENRYPGVACDVPAHIYTFPFEPNPDWSTFYASGPEIWAYIKKTTDKYRLDEYVQLCSRVVEAVWDEASGTWRLKIEKNGQIIETRCEVFIDGSGFLNNWHWPDIKGLHDFKGHLMHSAAWDSSVDWTGKRVAVIGNGSSAIQIVPQVQKKAAQVTNYIRSPTWISPNFAAEFTKDGTNFEFSQSEKQHWRENPAAHLKMRKEIEHNFNKFFYALFINSPEQNEARAHAQKEMRERLCKNAELCEQLIPSWHLGCRRLTPGDGYLEALQASNTVCNFSSILHVTEEGIQSQDSYNEFDIIVCATGFDVSFCPPFKIQGRNGHQLDQDWTDSPQAYFGIAAADHPNYFIFNGPNSPVGHGSLLESTLCVTRWILQWCRKIATERIKSVCVKQMALDDYNVYSQEFLKRMVWSGGCRSWYKNGTVHGKVTAMYAGSVLQFREILESFRVEDFDIEYRSANRFCFMGNGTTMREKSGGDLSFYMEK